MHNDPHPTTPTAADPARDIADAALAAAFRAWRAAHDDIDPVDLARTAYTAYADSTGWLSVRGEQLPSWDGVAEQTQNAWIASAQAVRRS